MPNKHLISKPIQLYLLGALLTIGSLASAGGEAEKSAFENCIQSNLAGEKAKNQPSVQGLLSTCSAQYSAYLATLPAGLDAGIRLAVEDQIKKMLQ